MVPTSFAQIAISGARMTGGPDGTEGPPHFPWRPQHTMKYSLEVFSLEGPLGPLGPKGEKQ
jgi:hypothetical protein